ncbi:MAG: hypothetical protein JWN38_642 [Candidatus Saccharibacteria bacterium]|nr:hypothetical protein [Candidatus Saccharibacteria bacterium]
MPSPDFESRFAEESMDSLDTTDDLTLMSMEISLLSMDGLLRNRRSLVPTQETAVLRELPTRALGAAALEEYEADFRQ